MNRWGAVKVDYRTMMTSMDGVYELEQVEGEPAETIARRADALVDAVRQLGLDALPWTDALRQWRERLGCLRDWCTDLSLPAVVGRAISGRLPGRVQRKSKEGEAPYPRQRLERLRLRGHAAAEGLAAGEQRQARPSLHGFGHGGAHGGMRQRRRVDALATGFHVRELVAQAGDAAGGQALRGPGHEGVRHAGAGAMRQHITSTGRVRAVEQGADAGVGVDLETKGSGGCVHGGLRGSGGGRLARHEHATVGPPS